MEAVSLPGLPRVTLNVIVYQYGKVASTSLVTTFNKMRGVSAHQCHFFGEDAFRATVTRLCNPDTNDYFFKHSLGQLAENLKAYRLYHRKDPAEDDRCIVLTVAREPFDWFRSSLVQEIEGHIPALTLSLRDRGVEFREAVIESARTRLRPVLMTSMCTAFGAIPLLLASGAGALSRQSIGAVVFFGVTCSVLLTLLVVPAVYSLVAKNTHSPEYVGQMIDKLKASIEAQRDAITERDEQIEKLQDQVADAHGFVVSHHKMELYGVCPECQKKGGRPRRGSPPEA